MEQDNWILFRKAAAVSHFQSVRLREQDWRELTQSDQRNEENDHRDVDQAVFYDLQWTWAKL